MPDLSSTVLMASVLLFMGGAITALGIERLYWSAKSGVVRMIIRKKEVLSADS